MQTEAALCRTPGEFFEFPSMSSYCKDSWHRSYYFFILTAKIHSIVHTASSFLFMLLVNIMFLNYNKTASNFSIAS